MKRGLKLKGQVSIFIIFTIMIISAIVLIVYSYKINNEERLNKEYFSQEEIKTQVENIQMNILMCLDVASGESLELIGKQGGYYKKNSRYIDLNETFLPYYYYEGEFLMPNEEYIIKELEKSIEEKTDACFKELYNSSFEIEYSYPIAIVNFNDGNVLIEVDSIVNIKKDKRSMIINLKDYDVIKPSKLKDILEISRYITEMHKIDSSKYCISCVEEKAREKDIYISFYSFEDNNVLVVIGENKTSDKPYFFNFLNKYTGNEISNDFNLTGEFSDAIAGNPGVK